MVVVVMLVVVNGWRRRGDKSTATAARPPHHCNRPRWTCKQPIQSPQPSHKLPASAAHHPQITGMEEDSSMSRNVHFTYITFRQKTHWQSIEKFPLSPNSTRKPREPGWARRSWKRPGWDLSLSHAALYLHLHHGYIHSPTIQISECYPARALRALGLLLADGAPTMGRGSTF